MCFVLLDSADEKVLINLSQIIHVDKATEFTSEIRLRDKLKVEVDYTMEELEDIFNEAKNKISLA